MDRDGTETTLMDKDRKGKRTLITVLILTVVAIVTAMVLGRSQHTGRINLWTVSPTSKSSDQAVWQKPDAQTAQQMQGFCQRIWDGELLDEEHRTDLLREIRTAGSDFHEPYTSMLRLRMLSWIDETDARRIGGSGLLHRYFRAISGISTQEPCQELVNILDEDPGFTPAKMGLVAILLRDPAAQENCGSPEQHFSDVHFLETGVSPLELLSWFLAADQMFEQGKMWRSLTAGKAERPATDESVVASQATTNSDLPGNSDLQRGDRARQEPESVRKKVRISCTAADSRPVCLCTDEGRYVLSVDDTFVDREGGIWTCNFSVSSLGLEYGGLPVREVRADCLSGVENRQLWFYSDWGLSGPGVRADDHGLIDIDRLQEELERARKACGGDACITIKKRGRAFTLDIRGRLVGEVKVTVGDADHTFNLPNVEGWLAKGRIKRIRLDAEYLSSLSPANISEIGGSLIARRRGPLLSGQERVTLVINNGRISGVTGEGNWTLIQAPSQ